MRLKFLFFPIMLAISVALIFGFVYPQYLVLRSERDTNALNIKDLGEINKKLGNISLLSADLEKNSPNLNIINSYLGTNAKEEKIIDYIDFLARNSSVSLVDISVEKATKPVVLAAVDNSTAKVSDINFTGIKINIFGEYEKIQMFADGLSRMELFNEILEYNILKIKETVAAEGAPPANPNMLSADFSIRVGYSPFVKNAKYDNLNENQTTLDFSVANKIQTIIKKSTPTLVLNGSGKSNPFLP